MFKGAKYILKGRQFSPKRYTVNGKKIADDIIKIGNSLEVHLNKKYPPSLSFYPYTFWVITRVSSQTV